MAKKVTSKDHFTSMLSSDPDLPSCLFLKARKRGSRVTTLEYEGKTYTPQRLAWTLAYGQPAPATRIVARCKHFHAKSGCCNLDHLTLVPLHYDSYTTPGKAGRPKGSKNYQGRRDLKTSDLDKKIERLPSNIFKKHTYY